MLESRICTSAYEIKNLSSEKSFFFLISPILHKTIFYGQFSYHIVLIMAAQKLYSLAVNDIAEQYLIKLERRVKVLNLE